MPYRFTPISSSANLPAIVNQVNRNFQSLDSEAVTKKFGQGDNQVIIGKAGEYVGMVVGDLNGDAVIFGRYQPDRIGTLYIENGVPVKLDGQAPDDGRQGSWQAEPGENVIELLGGTW